MLGKLGAKLFSRRVRTNALNGKSGLDLLQEVGERRLFRRKIDNTAIVQARNSNGIISKIWDAGAKFVTGLWDGIKWVSLILNNITGWLEAKSTQLSNFNWNATDEDLERAAKDYNQAIYAAWGGVVAKGIGYVGAAAIGFGVGLAMPVIGGGILARTITTNVLTEAFDDIWDELLYAIRLTIDTWGKKALIFAYIRYRKSIKNLPEKTLVRLYGEENAYWIKEQWGEKGEPNLSFQEWQDDKVDNIKSENWKAFWEEVVDEAWDAFWEGGYVISGTVLDAYEQTWQALEDSKGPQRELIIYPDKNAKDETIVIYPQPQEQAIQTANTSLNLYRQIYNRDVGDITGDLASERIKASITGRALHLHFHERPEPPFRLLDGSQGQRAEVRIPNPLTTLTYSQIRKKCKPYKYGRFKADLSMSSGRHINVWAESKEVALYKANELAELSMDSVINQNVWEEVETDPSRRKKNVLLYPRKGSLSQPHTPLSRQDSRDVPKKAFAPVTKKFFLWADEEPFDFPSFAIDTNLNNS